MFLKFCLLRVRTNIGVCQLAIIFCTLIYITGCSTQTEHRQAGLWDNPDNRNYELAFLEFTERGNLFHRDRLIKLVDNVSQRSNTLVLVFIHGWKHNASENDSNVQDFRKLLNNLSKVNAFGRKKVLGIYLGWPGLSISTPLLQEGSFWARKSVAQEVGKGGVTEALLRLERSSRRSKQNENLFLVMGHSFGGAIVLSALNEVLLERLVNSTPNEGCYQATWPEDTCNVSRYPCVRTEAFGHGVILLNPAIEANQILQLKELVAEHCYPKNQDKLLHVISTQADKPTHHYFPLGQRIAMAWWGEEENLDRVYRNESIPISEITLDRTTVGNIDQFWTGRLMHQNGSWRYCSFALDNFKNCPESLVKTPKYIVPARTFEPISFIYTQEDFMKGHNDVFNPRVAAYIGAVAMEALSRRDGAAPDAAAKEGLKDCVGSYYSFGKCFDAFNSMFSDSFVE